MSIEENIFWCTVGVLSCLVAMCVGVAIGRRQSDRYWAAHADDEFGRTCVHHDGRFYYVIPESEYCELCKAIRATEVTQGLVEFQDDDPCPRCDGTGVSPVGPLPTTEHPFMPPCSLCGGQGTMRAACDHIPEEE